MARYTAHRRPRRTWQPEELAQLRRDYATSTNIDLALLLDRPKCSVESKAQQLGLQKAPGFVPARSGPKRKLRNTFSDTPAAPTSEDAVAILALWSAAQHRRFKNRAYDRVPAEAVPCAVQAL